MIAAVALVMHLGVNAYGVRGTGTLMLDPHNGHFVRRFTAGAASEQEGWDGIHAWRADATGTSRVQGNTGERGEILQWSNALVQAVNARAHDAHLAGSTDRVTVHFEAYRRFGTVALPSRIVFDSKQNGSWTADVRSVERARLVDAAAFAPPHRRAADFRLDRSTQIPISMADGSPTLTVSVNGHALHFLFDTGGQNVITAEAAKRIGLRALGGGVVSGGGGGTTTIEFATARTVRVGDAQLFNQPFIVLPADALPRVDGIVGYELLARIPARLDMAHGTLTLAPNAGMLGAAEEFQPFEYDDRQPQMSGSIDDLSGAFTIDTGSSLTAQVQTPIVRSQHLIDRFHAAVIAYARDVGGRYPIYIVRARRLRLGNAAFADPLLDLLTRISTSDNSSIVANVGDGILRRWIIIFDYPNQRLALLPGGDPSGIVVHDHSGIVLATKGDALIAGQVFGGTPAAQAGIAEGAQISSVNGAKVTAKDLDRVRALLRGAPGMTIHLQLADGTVHAFALRAYL
jgi:hypothetical protein